MLIRDTARSFFEVKSDLCLCTFVSYGEHGADSETFYDGKDINDAYRLLIAALVDFSESVDKDPVDVMLKIALDLERLKTDYKFDRT